MADLTGFRPAAIDGHQIYQWWHVEGKGPEQTTNHVADYWKGAAKRLGQHGADIEKLMSDAGGHWEGAGADAMQLHVSPLAQWATAAQGVCGQMQGHMENQGQTWADAKPKIQQIDQTPPDPGFSDLWPLNYKDKLDKWSGTYRTNVQAMNVYGEQTQANLQQMPTFTPPQSSQGQLGVGTGPGPNVDYRSGNPGNVGSYNYSGTSPSGAQPGPYHYQPGPGGPSQPVGPQPPYQGPTPTPGPVPQPNPLPNPGGPIGNDPSGANPTPGPTMPGFNDPSTSGGQYGAGGSGGSGGGFLGGGFGAGGGDFSGGGRAGGVGGRAGAGAPGGFGAEDEFGPKSGRGMGAAGGRPGAPGQSGMGAGGRGGKGEEDAEHRSPSYLEEIEDVFGIGEKVAPPVIGEE